MVFIILSVFILSTPLGCARYATSDDKLAKMEKKVSIGVSEDEFKTHVPEARLINESGNEKVYVVVVNEACFICGSASAFRKSFETHATQFVFEDGKLVSFTRIADGR